MQTFCTILNLHFQFENKIVSETSDGVLAFTCTDGILFLLQKKKKLDFKKKLLLKKNNY